MGPLARLAAGTAGVSVPEGCQPALRIPLDLVGTNLELEPLALENRLDQLPEVARDDHGSPRLGQLVKAGAKREDEGVLDGRRPVPVEDHGHTRGERARGQKWEVRPAPVASPSVEAGTAAASSAFSYQEYAYLPSSRSFANCVSRSGWNVSHMTASSWVSRTPIDFSANPGCGPCGSPDGCSVIDPTLTPLREPKFPET